MKLIVLTCLISTRKHNSKYSLQKTKAIFLTNESDLTTKSNLEKNELMLKFCKEYFTHILPRLGFAVVEELDRKKERF